LTTDTTDFITEQRKTVHLGIAFAFATFAIAGKESKRTARVRLQQEPALRSSCVLLRNAFCDTLRLIIHITARNNMAAAAAAAAFTSICACPPPTLRACAAESDATTSHHH
jgi:hypothetical protein